MLRGRERLELGGRPPHLVRSGPERLRPAVLFLPAIRRTGGSPALQTIADLEARAEDGMTGTVVLMEEPELYLRPQAQRYLARLLHRLAEMGNQVIYATRSPAFLNVARIEELFVALLAVDPEAGLERRVCEPADPAEGR